MPIRQRHKSPANPSQVEVTQGDHRLQLTAAETGISPASDSSRGLSATAGTAPCH